VLDHLAALRDPSVVASCGQVTGLSRSTVSGDPTGHPLLHRAGAMPWHVGHGSNLAARRDALRECGGWDERLGPGTALPAGEDADLLARLLEQGGAIRSGVGAPVVHLAWRSDEDNAANLSAYERGAGYWIGKAMRERRPAAHYVRGRLRLHRQGRRPGVRSAFAAGLLRGLRLTPASPGSMVTRMTSARRE
jgi:GT2 family glycosyltransferase